MMGDKKWTSTRGSRHRNETEIRSARAGLQDRRQLSTCSTYPTHRECNKWRQRIKRFKPSYVPGANDWVQKSARIPNQHEHPTVLGALQQAAWRYMQENDRWPTLGRDRRKTGSKRTDAGRDQDHVTRIIREHSSRHSQREDYPPRLASTRERKPSGLLHQNNKITYNSSIFGTQAGSRFHIQAWQEIVQPHDRRHELVGGIIYQKIPSGTETW